MKSQVVNEAGLFAEQNGLDDRVLLHRDAHRLRLSGWRGASSTCILVHVCFVLTVLTRGGSQIPWNELNCGRVCVLVVVDEVLEICEGVQQLLPSRVEQVQPLVVHSDDQEHRLRLRLRLLLRLRVARGARVAPAHRVAREERGAVEGQVSAVRQEHQGQLLLAHRARRAVARPQLLHQLLICLRQILDQGLHFYLTGQMLNGQNGPAVLRIRHEELLELLFVLEAFALFGVQRPQQQSAVVHYVSVLTAVERAAVVFCCLHKQEVL